MVSGTFVLTDTINAGFNAIFTDRLPGLRRGRHRQGRRSAARPDTRRRSPSRCSRRIRALPDVADADGGVGDQAQSRRLERQGDRARRRAEPRLQRRPGPTALQPADARRRHVAARAERGRRRRAHRRQDRTSRSARRSAVGATGRQGAGFRIAGDRQVRRASTSLGGATLAIFDLPTAQKLFHKVGKLDQIDAAAKPGTTAQALVAADPEGPAAEHAGAHRPGQARRPTKETDATSSSFLQNFLLAFGFIALFVGAFVIANTLSITIAQRTREFATLRPSARRGRQVRRSVLIEGARDRHVRVAGRPRSSGSRSPRGSTRSSRRSGSTCRRRGLVFALRTVIVSMALGIIVTLLASLRPAFRATRVPPIAAVREGSILPPSRFARFGPDSRARRVRRLARADSLQLVRERAHAPATA